MKLAAALVACTVLVCPADVAITHVTLIDTEAGSARRDVTVVISGDRIATVRDAKSIEAPDGAQIIDGRGKFLIPGLWDMHVHMYATPDMNPADGSARTFFAPRFVANGVTGVRSMFDRLTAIEELRTAAVAPRIVTAGPMLDGPHPFWPGAIACETPEQGRAAVRKLKREGVDFIKVYSLLSPDAYLAIADESKKAGLPFAGHVPNSMTVTEASDAGQASVEHLLGVFAACSSRDTELGPQHGKFGESLRAAAQSYDPQKAALLFAKFVKNRTWQTPTLAVLRGAAYLGDPNLAKDDRMDSLPQTIAQFWKGAAAQANPADLNARKQQFERELKLVGAMHRAGVKILAGSDTPNPYVYPGESLHTELQLLVEAGFTPMEAIQAATIRAAEYLGKTDQLGSIAPGKFADLVLLAADPLADIANTRRIEAVILNGKFLDRRALDALLTPDPQ